MIFNRILAAMALLIFVGMEQAGAAPIWRNDAPGLSETDIRSIAPLADKRGILAASSKSLYFLLPETQVWKKALTVRTPDEIVEIVADPQDSKGYWLATRRTLRRSEDSGRSWKIVFRRDLESGFQFRTLRPEGKDALLVGTTQGLYRLHMPDHQWTAVDGAPKNTAVDSLVSTDKGWVIGTARGIYRTDAALEKWDVLDADVRQEQTGDSDVLGQFAVEEIALTPALANAVAWRGDGRVYLGKKDGVYEAAPLMTTVSRLVETHGFRVRRLAADERFIYLATDRGVYRLSPDSKSVESISEGLESLDVSTVAVDSQSGTVWAGTRKGLFRMDSFEGTFAVPQISIQSGAKENPVIALPLDEPTITQIQHAAVQYAEVSPDKIKNWRDAAAKRAWLPSVSLDTDLGRDQNIDLDRGGTNDPDRFIMGPEEKTFDWSVGVSWDLGDLVWNDDQTSIDSRSRLMVELRNDILNDVTHLFFERRRVQMELAALPSDVHKLRLEKQLKLEELTAQIDALTGGYMTHCLSKGAKR